MMMMTIMMMTIMLMGLLERDSVWMMCLMIHSTLNFSLLSGSMVHSYMSACQFVYISFVIHACIHVVATVFAVTIILYAIPLYQLGLLYAAMFAVCFLTGGRLLYKSAKGAVVIFDPSSNTTEELVPANIIVRT